ncbi:unnamed protein product [Pleuronectes platessa]|uniref:Uncharacterized protein n=1 Tax=Pleuronectes platessa TaxID=8262 RepID=A0A9N7YMQ5_PLEPL|nr:unnamed protein product [Pleuronectes platessa]
MMQPAKVEDALAFKRLTPSEVCECQEWVGVQAWAREGLKSRRGGGEREGGLSKAEVQGFFSALLSIEDSTARKLITRLRATCLCTVPPAHHHRATLLLWLRSVQVEGL